MFFFSPFCTPPAFSDSLVEPFLVGCWDEIFFAVPTTLCLLTCPGFRGDSKLFLVLLFSVRRSNLGTVPYLLLALKMSHPVCKDPLPLAYTPAMWSKPPPEDALDYDGRDPFFIVAALSDASLSGGKAMISCLSQRLIT